MADGGTFRPEWLRPATPVPPGEWARPAAAPIADGATCPVCPSLPSSDTAYDLVCGKPSAVLFLLRDLLGRGALVGTGVYFVDRWLGEDSVKKAALRGLGGAAMIELCVIIYVWINTRRQRRAQRLAQRQIA